MCDEIIQAILTGSVESADICDELPPFRTLTPWITQFSMTYSDTLMTYSPFCQLSFLLKIWNQFSFRLTLLSHAFPAHGIRIASFGRRQWNSVVLNRPHGMQLLQSSANRLITKSSTFLTCVVYHPDKLSKFLRIMSGSAFLVKNEYSWIFLCDAFARYHGFLDPVGEAPLFQIEALLQNRAPSSILGIESLFDRITGPLSPVYVRRLSNACEQLPKDIVRLQDLIDLAEILRETNEHLAVELITGPLLSGLRAWYPRLFSLNLIRFPENFIGFLGAINSGVLPVVKFAFWAIGRVIVTPKRMQIIRKLLPIRVLAFNILNGRHLAAFLPLWAPYVSRMNGYRDFVKAKLRFDC
jgi:hypothetical protein